ncbi:MAG TPA: hypothetical protein VFP35_00090 [Candidatus Saccharimonadales bacterium]|nr:hypothetical protein [Candidatus Saccharimonadales bacterium]
MSGIRSSAKKVLNSYALRERTRNPKTHPLKLKKREALKTYGDKLYGPLVKMFVCTAVSHFADGDVRTARRFYDGAFEFGTRDQVRGCLLGHGLAAARQAFASGDSLAVLRLLAAVHAYPPDSLSPDDINRLFVRWGVPLEGIGRIDLAWLTSDERLLSRLRSAGVRLPITVAA